MTPLTSTCRPLCLPVRSQKAEGHRDRLQRCRVLSQKGFGEAKKKTKIKQAPVSFKRLKKAGMLDSQQGWIPVAKSSELKGEKDTCPVITSTGIPLVLYRMDGEVFCSDANSTAYKFPMNDARLFEGPQGPAAECPLDGTTYDLRTGKVLEWCPKNNPMRTVLGALKSQANPKPLGVYDVVLTDDGSIFAKLF